MKKFLIVPLFFVLAACCGPKNDEKVENISNDANQNSGGYYSGNDGSSEVLYPEVE